MNRKKDPINEAILNVFDEIFLEMERSYYSDDTSLDIDKKIKDFIKQQQQKISPEIKKTKKIKNVNDLKDWMKQTLESDVNDKIINDMENFIKIFDNIDNINKEKSVEPEKLKKFLEKMKEKIRKYDNKNPILGHIEKIIKNKFKKINNTLR